jgi:putative transposase
LEPRAVPAKTNEREWDEACRRDDHIRALLEQFPKGRIGKAAICATAGALGVATATLYRLIRRFRKEQRVSALLPGKRGRPVGTLAIPESVENIIQESIKKIYLVPERPSLKELTRM